MVPYTSRLPRQGTCKRSAPGLAESRASRGDPHGRRSSGQHRTPVWAAPEPGARKRRRAPGHGRRTPEQPTDAKPQEGGPPPPPDMEELVEDIEYEARVDRDVSGVVDVVRDRSQGVEDHGKSILDVAGKCAEQADDDVEALTDEDGCVDPEAVASKCRKVRLQLGDDISRYQTSRRALLASS